MKKKKLYTTPECDVINVQIEGNLLQETKQQIARSPAVEITDDNKSDDGGGDYGILAKPHRYDGFTYDHLVGWDE